MPPYRQKHQALPLQFGTIARAAAAAKLYRSCDLSKKNTTHPKFFYLYFAETFIHIPLLFSPVLEEVLMTRSCIRRGGILP